jgi:hypothetical protein
MNEADEMVTIAAVSSAQADLMRMYLEADGIPVFLHGEFIGTAVPHVAAPAGAGAIRVQVPQSREQEARALLEQMTKQDTEGTEPAGGG